MRITALKNATHVEVTKFTPEKERTYYIWVTKDQRGKEVLATNLAGQRVNADFKGIVIHHGKKMLKK